jgi:hypothetical protein
VGAITDAAKLLACEWTTSYHRCGWLLYRASTLTPGSVQSSHTSYSAPPPPSLPTYLVPLEQEHVLGAIAAMDGQLAWPLLAADDLQLGRKGGDGHQRLTRDVGPRHSQLHALSSEGEGEGGYRRRGVRHVGMDGAREKAVKDDTSAQGSEAYGPTSHKTPLQPPGKPCGCIHHHLQCPCSPQSCSRSSTISLRCQPCAQTPHLRPHQGGGHILQLQLSQGVQLLVDLFEHVVVQVPGLVQLRVLAAGAVLEQPLIGLAQLAAIGLGR